jgi:hypothetical protein
MDYMHETGEHNHLCNMDGLCPLRHRGHERRGKEVNAKRKGARNEYKSIRLLESLGYSCVRSSASLGVFDVVGISGSDIVLIQVKSNSWPSSVEMESIRNFPAPHNARRLVHRWRDRARLPDVREL